MEDMSEENISEVEAEEEEITHMEENMKSYLRTRLEKIERYTIHILSEEAARESGEAYLTPGELRFAKNYLNSVENLFKALALQHMPANFQGLDANKMSTKPNMKTHVFVKAKESISGIILPDVIDEEIDFEVGSQHIITYNAVAKFVKNGAIQLI
ncbi:hypothetical protein KPH14_012236 [Odynerus spinipes]|uniref:DNA replication complex GINS protein SLD5 n=1 Tax=Odynerus spinipes TaxID=1348599 RepID=A0AAD9VM87_9HYME|nr:hypothetical protein KPH14_012236 [Odynerus spinipes]